jgi:ribonuclease J
MDFFDLFVLLDIKPILGSTFIHSLTEPFNEEMEIDFDKMQNWLDKFNVSLKHAHASGHANRNQLKEFSDTISVKQIFPIHTENTMLFKEFAKENVRITELNKSYKL